MVTFCGGRVGLIEHATNQLSDVTIGAAIEVRRHLGPGLLESSYHACLCRELGLRGIAHESHVALPVHYKGIQLSKGYIIDLLIENSLVRNKIRRQTPADSFRTTHYLHALARGIVRSSDELQRSPSPPRHQENAALILLSVQLPCLPCFRGEPLLRLSQ
jgi:GxxExxY protein